MLDPITAVHRLAPGLALCLAVMLAAYATESGQTHLFGRAWLEALVMAIVIGTVVRSLWSPGPQFAPGIDAAAKSLLEIAVMLLGLSVSAGTVFAAGAGLLFGIFGVVALAIALSYAIGRGLGLPHKMAVLIACGNAICGNSAIAATAPIIRAESGDVAASIAFTAVLGVLVVLALPFATQAIGLDMRQSGIFAGLTVYAVPQVIAATAPIGPVSVQIGTLVKLVRVLMLGPVVLLLSLAGRRDAPDATPLEHVSLTRLVPWFILGFLAMIGLHSTGFVPAPVLTATSCVANGLTVVAMAALGLSVDIRMVATAGLRVTGVVILSLLALAGMSLALIALIGAP